MRYKISSYCTVDIETGSKEEFSRKGNPLTGSNPIIAACFKHQNEEARVYYKEKNWERVLEEELGRTKRMVAFNAKFECLHFWKYEVFQDWLRKGGMIYCPQLAEFMLEGQKVKYPGLRDIAVRKYGCKEREKMMEKYWDQGIDTADIPRDLVINDVLNDVLDTEKVMLKQVKEVKKQGMYTLIIDSMDGLLATTEMEYNGLMINQEVMNINEQKVTEQIQNIEEELRGLINE